MRWKLFNALFGVAVFISALTLLQTRYANRQLFLELQRQQNHRDQLEVEWGRLQLEQSTWARPSRVEAVAREKLGMRIPPPETVVMVKP